MAPGKLLQIDSLCALKILQAYHCDTAKRFYFLGPFISHLRHRILLHFGLCRNGESKRRKGCSGKICIHIFTGEDEKTQKDILSNK